MTHRPSTAGAFHLSGSSSCKRGFLPRAAGVFLLTGSSLCNLGVHPRTEGNLPLTGSSPCTLNIHSRIEGALLLSGSGPYKMSFHPSTAGAFALSGSGPYKMSFHPRTAGDLHLSGNSPCRLNVHPSTEGNLPLTGKSPCTLNVHSRIEGALLLSGSALYELRVSPSLLQASSLVGRRGPLVSGLPSAKARGEEIVSAGSPPHPLQTPYLYTATLHPLQARVLLQGSIAPQVTFTPLAEGTVLLSGGPPYASVAYPRPSHLALALGGRGPASLQVSPPASLEVQISGQGAYSPLYKILTPRRDLRLSGSITWAVTYLFVARGKIPLAITGTGRATHEAYQREDADVPLWRYEGDPRLTLTSDGADLSYESGNPIMDQGYENYVLLALFTRPGWVGNDTLPREHRLGSRFEEYASRPITITSMEDLRLEAERALRSPEIDPHVEVSNPTGNELHVSIVIRETALQLVRSQRGWQSQRIRPAHQKGEKT